MLVSNNTTGMVRGAGPVFTFNNNQFIGNVGGNGPFAPAFTTASPL